MKRKQPASSRATGNVLPATASVKPSARKSTPREVTVAAADELADMLDVGEIEEVADLARQKVRASKPEQAPAEPQRKHAFQGNLDSCGPSTIAGWLYDKENPGLEAEVEIRVDGKPVAKTRANKFRMDLLEGGVGAGMCAFEMPLPDVLFDDAEHVVEAREVTTGFLLGGSPRIVGSAAVRGEIKLEHGALVGTTRVRNADSDTRGLEVFDLESGKLVARGQAQPDQLDPRLLRFQIHLPAAVFDGRPHAFSVRAAGRPVLLHEIAVIMPYVATPESVLLQYARDGLAPSLATAAGYRYDSLAKAVEHLAASTSDSAGIADRIAQLARVHAQLARGFSERDKEFAPLVFPQVEAPTASIVIPVHNKFHVTYHCLASLLLAANKASFEVILVDDGSKDTTTKVPELIQGIQYLRHDEARGFILSCNGGAALARGQYVVMLNNDTEVTAGWLDELLWPFEHFEKVGMTGAKLLYPDGSLQEAGGIVWKTGNPWNYGRNANARDPRYNYARQTDYLSGACVMLPTPLWKEIGGFSETYLPAYFEDTDLGFQVRARGFKTVYAPMAQVFHFEGVSNGTQVSSGIKRFQEINRPKFKARWGGVIRDNGNEGVDVELNKDRNVALRALVIDAQMPMPDQDAGGYAAVQEMRMLQGLGFKCTFVPQNMAWMSRYTQDLQRMGVECLYAPFYTSMNQVLEERGKEFDLVYVTRYYVAQHYVEMIRQFAPQAKLVLMNADLHFLRELRAAIQARSAEGLAKSVQTREEELSVMRRVDLVLAYTDVEKAVIMSHNLDSTKVEKCPWVTEVATAVPRFGARKDIAFLGGFNHHPNAQAVEWFVANVMPLLRQQLPGVNFRVYGSHLPDSLAASLKEHADVVAEGWVPSVNDVYDTCRVFVAPLQTGAGIKGKVIGALAQGVPTVMTPIAAEGIGVNDGTDGFIADKPQDWVNAIVKLYEDEKQWAKVSAAALELARRQFGLERGVAQMRQALQQAELFTTETNATLFVRH